MTVMENALDDVMTYTYSGTQPGMLTAQTAPAPVGTGSYTLVSYQYDSQDRLTTITNADSDVTVKAVQQRRPGHRESRIPNGTCTTYSFDAMNRETGMTNAAGTGMAGVATIRL